MCFMIIGGGWSTHPPPFRIEDYEHVYAVVRDSAKEMPPCLPQQNYENASGSVSDSGGRWEV